MSFTLKKKTCKLLKFIKTAPIKLTDTTVFTHDYIRVKVEQ